MRPWRFTARANLSTSALPYNFPGRSLWRAVRLWVRFVSGEAERAPAPQRRGLLAIQYQRRRAEFAAIWKTIAESLALRGVNSLARASVALKHEFSGIIKWKAQLSFV